MSAVIPLSTTNPADHDEVEEILRPNSNRFILFPIKYPDIWEMYKKHEASFWTTEEIDLGNDMKDWETLSDDERHFLEHVLAFFAASDGIIIENLAQQFLVEVQIPECRAFFCIQIMMENIHSETYALLLDAYVKDSEKKHKLMNAISTIPCIKQKAEWALKWIDPKRPFAERLIAFAAVEGIFFSGSFCAIFWMKKRGKMPGLTFSNELISRDEALHGQNAIVLFHHLKNRPSEALIHEIFKDAVKIEKSFVCDSLPVSLIGMNAQAMSEYIEFVADRFLTCLGCSKIWNTKTRFPLWR